MKNVADARKKNVMTKRRWREKGERERKKKGVEKEEKKEKGKKREEGRRERGETKKGARETETETPNTSALARTTSKITSQSLARAHVQASVIHKCQCEKGQKIEIH